MSPAKVFTKLDFERSGIATLKLKICLPSSLKMYQSLHELRRMFSFGNLGCRVHQMYVKTEAVRLPARCESSRDTRSMMLYVFS
jgi:hypothetical protein